MRLSLISFLVALAASQIAAFPAISDRSAKAAVPPPVDHACYYKRDAEGKVGSYRRDPSGAVVACEKKREASPAGGVVAVDHACYNKRDAHGNEVGYKRDPSGAEIPCQTLKTREPESEVVNIKDPDKACYYKRDAEGNLAGYKRDATGAEITCGGS